MYSVHEGTNAGKNNGVIIPLIVPSALRFLYAVRSKEGCWITQNPALDTHLDSNRNTTATVGRISSGMEAPIISPPRLCDK